uniref:Uncharacterized protein n=1 Tax=Arundo donax TaxID=35708 RepID=A0A0A8Z4M9_ARUDO
MHVSSLRQAESHTFFSNNSCEFVATLMSSNGAYHSPAARSSAAGRRRWLRRWACSLDDLRRRTFPQLSVRPYGVEAASSTSTRTPSTDLASSCTALAPTRTLARDGQRRLRSSREAAPGGRARWRRRRWWS